MREYEVKGKKQGIYERVRNMWKKNRNINYKRVTNKNRKRERDGVSV